MREGRDEHKDRRRRQSPEREGRDEHKDRRRRQSPERKGRDEHKDRRRKGRDEHKDRQVGESKQPREKHVKKLALERRVRRDFSWSDVEEERTKPETYEERFARLTEETPANDKRRRVWTSKTKKSD